MTLLFIGGLGLPEILVIVFIVLLLFGGKKIPEMMRGLGKGVRSFKEGMNEVEKEVRQPLSKQEDAAAQSPSAPAADSSEENK